MVLFLSVGSLDTTDRGGHTMSRAMPTECPHGTIIDWGDFGPDDGQPETCDECDLRSMTVTVWTDHGQWAARVDHDGPTILYDGYDTATEIYDQLADAFAQWDDDQ